MDETDYDEEGFDDDTDDKSTVCVHNDGLGEPIYDSNPIDPLIETSVDIALIAPQESEFYANQVRELDEATSSRSPTRRSSLVVSRGGNRLLPSVSPGRVITYEEQKNIIGNRINTHLLVIKKEKLRRNSMFKQQEASFESSTISTEKSGSIERSIPRTPLRRLSVSRRRESSPFRKEPSFCSSPIRTPQLRPISSSLGSIKPQKQRHKLIISYSKTDSLDQSNPPSDSSSSYPNEYSKNSLSPSLRRIDSTKAPATRPFSSPKKLGETTRKNSIKYILKESVYNRDLNNEREKYKLESLVRWNFAIPFDSRNCIVDISVVTDVYNEFLYYSVTSATPPYRKFSSGSITLDLAYDLTNKARFSSTSTDEEMLAIRSLLHNLFLEADKDSSGSLSFEEIQGIIAKINIGLSPQEISLIIASADVDASGEVDYNEFVPLAVDMINNSRTKSKAKQRVNDLSPALTEIVLSSMDTNELKRIANLCLQYMKAIDVNDVGVVSAAILRSRLLNASVGLTSYEINMIVSSLPRDSVGRCIYKSFYEVLFETRFISLKNIVLESQGTDLQKYLIELCKTIEQRYLELIRLDNHHATPGTIPLKMLISSLMSSDRLGLTRLQTLMVCSEANVNDGFVNLHQFVPMAVKLIELMFDPESLRARSILLSTTDLSIESLLDINTAEPLEKRLKLLFSTHDKNHNGELDLHQFSMCIEWMNVGLKKTEIQALMTVADLDKSGTINFDEFSSFVTDNVIALVKEKKLTELQRKSMTEPSIRSILTHGANFKLHEDLLEICSKADSSGSGSIDFLDFCKILRDISRGSELLFDLALAEVDISKGFNIQYADVVAQISKLCIAYDQEVKQSNDSSSEKKMDIKVSLLSRRLYADVLESTANHISDNIVQISAHADDPIRAFHELVKVIKCPSNDLSRIESNYLLIKIGTSNQPDDTKSLHEVCTKENIRGILFRAHKLSIIRSLLYHPNSEETVGIINEKLISLASKLQKRYEHDGPLHLPLQCCLVALEGIPSLNLRRSSVFEIIFWCNDPLGENLINRKSFALQATTIIERMGSAAYLEARAFVIENSMGIVEEYDVMNGLSSQIFSNYLSQTCLAICDFSGEISLDTFRAIMREVPRLRLTQKEVLMFESNFIDEPFTQKIHWRSVLSWGYICLVRIKKECRIGRRIGLAAMFCTRGPDKTSTEHFKQALARVAEDLLSLVKLQHKSGVVLATFPDAEKFIVLKEENSPDAGKGNSLTTFHSKKLKIIGYEKLFSIDVRISAAIESISLESPTILTLTVEKCDSNMLGIPFKEFKMKIPSIVEVDDEVAGCFCENAIDCLQARFDGENKTFLLEFQR